VAKLQSEINKLITEKNIQQEQYKSFKEKLETETGKIKGESNIEIEKQKKELEKIAHQKEELKTKSIEIQKQLNEQIIAAKQERDSSLNTYKSQINSLIKEKSELSDTFLSETLKLERENLDRQNKLQSEIEQLKTTLSAPKNQAKSANPVSVDQENAELRKLKSDIQNLVNEKQLLNEHYLKEKDQLRVKLTDFNLKLEKQIQLEKNKKDKMEEEFKNQRQKIENEIKTQIQKYQTDIDRLKKTIQDTEKLHQDYKMTSKLRIDELNRTLQHLKTDSQVGNTKLQNQITELTTENNNIITDRDTLKQNFQKQIDLLKQNSEKDTENYKSGSKPLLKKIQPYLRN